MTDATVAAFVSEPEAEVLRGSTDLDPSRLDRVTARFQALRDIPGLTTWIGVALIALSAVVIAVGWAKSASLIEVGRQVPLLISAGFTGIGLLVVGVTLINLTAKSQDSARRRAQADELAAALAAIRQRLEGEEP